MIVVGLGHYGIESAYLIETGQFTESQFVESIAFTQYKELAPQVYILTEPSFKNLSCMSTFVRIHKKHRFFSLLGCTPSNDHLKWKPPKTAKPYCLKG